MNGVLVTGGTGFVGPRVVHALRARDLPVRCLVRERTSDAAHQLETWGCELVQGEMTDAESLRRAVEGAETVVHLVAIRQGRPEEFERVMVQGTRDLVEAARAAGGRRFVLMSALGASEETKELVPYYGAKWEMEQTLRRSGLDHVIFRPSFVFARDGGILATFRKLARLAPVTPVIGPGTQRIQPIWVDDVAEYFARSVDLGEATNRTFELGGPDAVTWNEFWERLRRALGVRRRPTVHLPVGFMRLNALVTERLPGNVPLTRDLLRMLEGPDNVVTNDDAPRTFGIEPVPLDEQLRRAAG
jgi:NADH dehydrogenase